MYLSLEDKAKQPCPECGGKRIIDSKRRIKCPNCFSKYNQKYREKNRDTLIDKSRVKYRENLALSGKVFFTDRPKLTDEERKERDRKVYRRWVEINPEKIKEYQTRAKSKQHPLLSRYDGMVRRCFNPKCPDYTRYGDRGITVCERWLGDSGYHTVSYYCAEYTERLLLNDWLHVFKDDVTKHRTPICSSHPELVDKTQDVWYRKQSESDLSSFAGEYDRFLSELSVIEERGYLLQEIYLGSCDFSIDCSLRGNLEKDNREFDFTVDFKDHDVHLGDSLREASTELKNDILTTTGE